MYTRPFFTRVQFEWPVAVNGHAVIKSEDTKLRIVPMLGPTRQTQPFNRYPGLFKQFADTEHTPEGMLRFANKFGLLQSGQHKNELEVWLRFQSDFFELTSRGIVEDATTWPDRQQSALNRINRMLMQGITTAILGEGGIVVRPHNLLAAMGFQLGLWAASEDEFIGQCVECGTTWVAGRGTGIRLTRRYCSNKCANVARFRRKKERLGEFWKRPAETKKPPPG